ncbi:hypothetical protein QL285_013152 [Trifolium repens]|nr:hypothetical protein QL285_013152 [Trifolium repens]
MSTFNIPWKFLDIDKEPSQIINAPIKQNKTFAQALTNLCDIPASQLQQPVVKGDGLAIEIPDEAYHAGLDVCKHNLHGRIIWPKGATPITVVALKEKLSTIWKNLSRWGIISLGRGYYEFTFSSLEDVKRVRSVPSWNINPGILKLFAWSRDFNPKLQQNTSAQVWMRIYGLAQEYWHKTILFTIAGSLGTPICMDATTAKPMHERTFGQYACILVDIDISQPLRYKVMVERKGFAFYVDLDYEHVPEYCSHCRNIGHHVDNCKRYQKGLERKLDKGKDNGLKKKLVVEDHTSPPVIHNQQEVTKSGNNEDEVMLVEGNQVGSVSRADVNEISTHSMELPIQEHLKEPHNNLAIPMVSNNNTPRFEGPVLSPVHTPRGQEDLEDEVNDVASDTSSQGTFVDATQHQLIVHEGTNNITPERVIQDMNFLKQSWANMVEEEEGTSNFLEGQDDGFQVVKNRGQKRNIKKLAQANRDTYTTKSKVVPSKPFK